MKKLGCLIVLCYLLTGAGLVWSLPPITSSSIGTASDNNTIRSVATQLVTGGTLPSASVTGGITASSYSATRVAADSVSNNHPQCTSLFEDADDGDSVFKHCAGALDGNATVTAVGSGINFGALNIATTGKINGGLDLVGDSDNHTLTATELYGGFIEMTGAGTVIINDNATTKMSFCVFSTGANTVLVRSYKPSDSIILKDGTDLGSGVAAKVTTAGQIGCFVTSSVADKWRQISGDTWVTE